MVGNNPGDDPYGHQTMIERTAARYLAMSLIAPACLYLVFSLAVTNILPLGVAASTLLFFAKIILPRYIGNYVRSIGLDQVNKETLKEPYKTEDDYINGILCCYFLIPFFGLIFAIGLSIELHKQLTTGTILEKFSFWYLSGLSISPLAFVLFSFICIWISNWIRSTTWTLVPETPMPICAISAMPVATMLATLLTQ